MKKSADKVIVALELTHEIYNVLFETAIKDIRRAYTPEDIMDAKRTLLQGIAEYIPIYCSSCYYCIASKEADGILTCKSCPYGAEHGICGGREDNTWSKIQNSIEALQEALGDY